MERTIRAISATAILSLCSVFASTPAFAADGVSLVWGPVVRTVDTKELVVLAQTNQAIGLTADILRVAKISPLQAAEALRLQYGIDAIFVSDIIDTPLATQLLSAIGVIVHPLRSGTRYAVPALRSAVILSLVDDNVLTPLEVIEKYPVQAAIDLRELLKLFQQAKTPEDLARVLRSTP
jgi:hypothetical protein